MFIRSQYDTFPSFLHFIIALLEYYWTDIIKIYLKLI